MRAKVYVDTSVIGGAYDTEFAKWSKAIIQEFIDGKKIMVLSDLTLREVERGPKELKNALVEVPDENKVLVALNDEAIVLADRYISEGAVSKNYLIDAQHIAIATIHRVDVMVSWNFKHIVNLARIKLYNSVNLKHGYPMIEIRSPREVLLEEEKL